MAFATVAELSHYTDSTVDADRGQLALELASAACENVAKTVDGAIALQTDVEVEVDGNGIAVVHLPLWPVVDVTTVEVDGDEVEDYGWTRRGTLVRQEGKRWPAGQRNIVVTYTYGLDPVPAEIKAVTLQAASRAVLNPARLNSFSDGQVSVGFGGGGLGTQVLDLLANEAQMVVRAIR